MAIAYAQTIYSKIYLEESICVHNLEHIRNGFLVGGAIILLVFVFNSNLNKLIYSKYESVSDGSYTNDHVFWIAPGERVHLI